MHSCFANSACPSKQIQENTLGLATHLLIKVCGRLRSDAWFGLRSASAWHSQLLAHGTSIITFTIIHTSHTISNHHPHKNYKIQTGYDRTNSNVLAQAVSLEICITHCSRHNRGAVNNMLPPVSLVSLGKQNLDQLDGHEIHIDTYWIISGTCGHMWPHP